MLAQFMLQRLFINFPNGGGLLHKSLAPNVAFWQLSHNLIINIFNSCQSAVCRLQVLQVIHDSILFFYSLFLFCYITAAKKFINAVSKASGQGKCKFFYFKSCQVVGSPNNNIYNSFDCIHSQNTLLSSLSRTLILPLFINFP